MKQLYGSICKVDAERRLVWGYASTEAEDSAGEIVRKSAIEDALKDYLEWGNIREMHKASAVGTAEEATVDDKGLYLCAKVVDDAAWIKVQEKVYKGFSIGGKVLARDPLARNTITKLALTEISLVDRPCNPEARFDIWKAAGIGESMSKEEAAKAVADALAKVEELKKGQDAAALAAAEDELNKAHADLDAIEKGEPASSEEPAVTEATVDPVAKALAAAAKLEEAVKEAEGESVEKSMWAVSDFANLLGSLSYMVLDAEFEKDLEGDNSKVPAKLRKWLTEGIEIFKTMAAEETAELLASGKTKKAAEVDDLVKAAGKPAEADVAAVVPEELAKAETAVADALAKVEALTKQLGERDDTLNKVASFMDDMTKRIASLEAQELPAKTAGPAAAAVAISKGQDASGGMTNAAGSELTAESFEKSWEALPQEQRAFILTKFAQSTPRKLPASIGG